MSFRTVGSLRQSTASAARRRKGRAMQKSMCIFALLAMLAAASGAAAEDFYRGKTIRMIVPSEAGGGYDYYGRTLAAHLRRHIPGEPNIIVQNMPGGGGLTSANW